MLNFALSKRHKRTIYRENKPKNADPHSGEISSQKEMMRQLIDAAQTAPHEATHKVKLTELIREKKHKLGIKKTREHIMREQKTYWFI